MRRPDVRRLLGVAFAAVTVSTALTRPAAADPSAADAVRVAQWYPDFLIVGTRPLGPQELTAVKAVRGVAAVEQVDAGRVPVGGRMTGVLGVQPETFRAYTPRPSALADQLWARIGAGDLAVSFARGTDYPLGRPVTAGAGVRGHDLRVGAYATLGIGDIEVVGSHQTVRGLGVTPGNALLVSAGDRVPSGLGAALREVLPAGAELHALDSRPAATEEPSGPAPAAFSEPMPQPVEYVPYQPMLYAPPSYEQPSYEQPSYTGRSYAAPSYALPRRRLGMTMSSQQVVTAVQAAAAKLGMPYVWGGESDREGGYDCSGLVQYAFGQAGIPMPRTAEQQSHIGWRIPFEQAQPGDLLTWKGDGAAGRVTHVAIYLGGGRMIAAPHRGTVVQVQRVYFRHLWGAIRVDPQLAAMRAAY